MARRPRRARRNTGLNWEKARKRDQVSRTPISRAYDPKKEARDRKAYRAKKTDSERRAEAQDRMKNDRTSEAYMKELASPRAIQAAEAAAGRGQEHPLFSLLSLIDTAGEDQATFALVHAYESVDPEAGHEGLSETPISSPIFAAKHRVAAMARLHDELHHLPHFLQGLRKAEEQMDFSDADAFAKAVRHLDNFAYGPASRNETWGKWRERKRPDVPNYFFLRGEAQRTGTRPPTQLAWYTPDDPEFAKLNPKKGGYIKSKMRTWTAQNNPQGVTTKLYRIDGAPYTYGKDEMVGGTQEDPILEYRTYPMMFRSLGHEVGDVFLIAPGGWQRPSWFYMESPERAVQVPYKLTWEMDKLKSKVNEWRRDLPDWAEMYQEHLEDEKQNVSSVMQGRMTEGELKASHKQRLRDHMTWLDSRKKGRKNRR